MPDPFSTLPLPLPLFIFNGLEDLGTLHYLLQASPAASALFAEHYCEIIESILSNFVPLLQRLLRAVVYTRSMPAQIRTQCDTVQAFDILRGNRFLDADAGAAPLTMATTTLAAARSLVETASQVQSLSATFFVTFLGKINKLEPYCSLERRPTLDNMWDPVPTESHRKYQILHCEEPSWIEEQRVLRALWRVVVYFELREILRPRQGQVSKVWNNLAQDGPRCVWWRPHPEWPRNPFGLDRCHMEEMDTIVDFLSNLQGTATQQKNQVPRLERLPRVDSNFASITKRTPSFSTMADDWSQLPSELGRPSPAYDWFHSIQKNLHVISRHCRRDPQLSLYGYDWGVYRSLGMGIWDRETLARLGLAAITRKWDEVPTAYRFSDDNCRPNKYELCVRWKSLRSR